MATSATKCYNANCKSGLPVDAAFTIDGKTYHPICDGIMCREVADDDGATHYVMLDEVEPEPVRAEVAAPAFAPAEAVTVTPIEATPAELLALLRDVAARADAAKVGQKFTSANGDVWEVTKVGDGTNGVSGVHVRCERDGYTGAYSHETWADAVAHGEITLIEPTAPAAPQIGDRVRVSVGAFSGRKGAVDKASDYTAAMRVRLDQPTADGRKAVWIFPACMEILPQRFYVQTEISAGGSIWQAAGPTESVVADSVAHLAALVEYDADGNEAVDGTMWRVLMMLPGSADGRVIAEGVVKR